MYKDLFIDLDRTLWDFETNATDTLKEIYDYHQLKIDSNHSFQDFIHVYYKVNKFLWELYRSDKITKSYLSVERFRKTMEILQQDESKAQKMAKQYISWSSLKKKLYPGVTETLEYLKKKYRLHIVTNGFNEVQFKKIRNSGLSSYFDTIITSDNAGNKKPDKAFFIYAFSETGAIPEYTLTIGDDEISDIEGAKAAGTDQVFVNYDKRDLPNLKPTYEINAFYELKEFL
ncbi:MAG: YjjG family noncanonical pyrimidine nucleotidase [Bacteroidales bacterium]|nr:YjjG family noncanonical pyrimidine nucleotidase [Bacteroidales bacterium]